MPESILSNLYVAPFGRAGPGRVQELAERHEVPGAIAWHERRWCTVLIMTEEQHEQLGLFSVRPVDHNYHIVPETLHEP